MLQVLQRNAFEKVQKNDQKLLVLKNFAQKVVLVLFSGNECPHCDKMKEILETIIPHFENNISFCTINLSEYPELVEASSDTATNITYVPYVLVYVNNIPYSKYEGNYSETEVAKFLSSLIQPERTKIGQVTQDIQANQVQAQQTKNFNPGIHSAQAGTYGLAPRPLNPPAAVVQPILMEKSSFLTFREAYS